MAFRILLICLAVCAGCDEYFCKRRMEIVPGMFWEYHAPLLEDFRPRYSRIVSDKHGVIVEGEIGQVHLSFHEYGFTISGKGKSGEGKCVYVDLLRNVLDEREATLIALQTEGKSFGGAFEATIAMGVYTKETHNDFLADMEALKKRVEAKLKQDGLRRL